MENITKLEAFEEFPYNLVEWKLHDRCNYDCYFCGDENKLGRDGWADLETNKKIVDSIVASATKPLWIQLTGGEPTLYPHFLELVKYMKSKGAMVRIITNGSRTMRWWKEVREADVLDLIYFTFHSQQNASYKHIAEVSNLFLDSETVTITLVTYVPNTLGYAIEGAAYLTEHTGSYISMNAMDLRPAAEEEKQYNEDEFEKALNVYNSAIGKLINIKKPTSIPDELIAIPGDSTIYYNNGSVETKDVTLMMKLGENRFQDWMCYAGMDSMCIDGKFKYRGGCKRNKTPYEPGKLTFFDKPFKCDVDACYCAMDMITTKIKDTE